MLVTADIAKVRRVVNLAKKRGKTVGFVPTMGALHNGHLSLVKAARRQYSFLVVSIFVNPIQFGPNEDFKRYPRNPKGDNYLLKKEGVDLVFYPKPKTIYPDDFSTFVDEKILSNYLCGALRPGHFRGVCTVVSKLFNIVQPDFVYFGQKDYQQAQIIKHLIKDLNFPIKITILPIVREEDGLALSSRNSYLSSKQRTEAVVINQALKLAKVKIGKGERAANRIVSSMYRLINSVKSAKIDYIAIVDGSSLKKVKKIKGRILIAVCVYIGKVRLIDNIICNVR